MQDSTATPAAVGETDQVAETQVGGDSWAGVITKLTRLSGAFVFVCLVALALAYGFPQDFRDDRSWYVWTSWTLFLVRVFKFHIGLAVAVVVLAALMLRRWRLAICAAPVMLFAMGPELWLYVPPSWRSAAIANPPASADKLRVMSANLLRYVPSGQPQIDQILAADPDIVVLQEYDTVADKAFRPALREAYPHARVIVRDDCFGQAIYSKLPLLEYRGDLAFADKRTRQMRAVVRVGSQPVAIYNIHTVPPGRSNMRRQRHEFADLVDLVRDEPLPAIVAGDLNCTSNTPFADALRGVGLRNTHALAGYGRGSTWPAIGLLKYAPGIRIDHIFISDDFTAAESRVLPALNSDHRAIVADVALTR